MSKISIDLIWKLENATFVQGKYSNKHKINFTPNISINGDSAPDWSGDPKNINPEQTLAASLSSCHMMTFLALAVKMNWPVLSYKDKAIATLGKNTKGMMSVTKIQLNPKVEFLKNFSIDEKKMKEMQDRAHRYCFIANSLAKDVIVEIN